MVSGARRLVLFLTALLAVAPSLTASADPRDVVAAVVGIRSEIPAEARTAGTLGRVREGSGVVIDGSGLVVTVGYIMLEAIAVDLFDADGRRVPAEVVGYDHQSGFGLLRASQPLKVRPVPLGRSVDATIGGPLLVLSRSGTLGGREVRLASRREFAGYWEYLLPDALFTIPAHRDFAGAALINPAGELVGIGSLFVGDAAAAGVESPGNMFVPIDALRPIMADLLADGRRNGPGQPWLGLSSLEHEGRVIVRSVADGGPAERAGVRPGDVVLAVDGEPVAGLADLYRKIWALGRPGVAVPLKILRQTRVIEFSVPSMDRMRWLRLDQTY